MKTTTIMTGMPGTGKTTELLMRSHETGARMVVADMEVARFWHREMEKAGTPIPMPYTFVEFRRAAPNVRGEDVLIDDLPAFLNYLIERPVHILAASIPEDHRVDVSLVKLNMIEHRVSSNDPERAKPRTIRSRSVIP